MMHEACSEPPGAKIVEFLDFIDGDQLKRLRSIFLARGKGRRPKLPVVEMSNGLLVQLLILKHEGGKSYDDTAIFLNKLFPDAELSRLRYLLVKAEEKAEQQHGMQEKTDFLSQPFEIEQLGPFLRETGITTQELLQGTLLKTCATPSCGLLKDLITFKHRQRGTGKDMCQWWKQLTGSFVKKAVMYSTIGKVSKKTARLASSAHREKGQKELDEFLASLPFPSDEQTVSPPSDGLTPLDSSQSEQSAFAGTLCLSSSDNTASSQPTHLSVARKLAEEGNQLSGARRKAQELTDELSALQQKFSVITDLNKKYFSEIQSLEAEKKAVEAFVEKTKAELKESEENNSKIAAVLKDAQTQLQYYKKQGVQKKLVRRDKKIEKANSLLQGTLQFYEKESKQNKLNIQKLRSLQLSHADLKRRHASLLNTFTAFQEQQVPKETEIHPEEEKEIPILRLKDELGHFKPQSKICIMALVCENEVPAHRCGRIIQTVARDLWGARVPDSDLPSQRSALRFADQGHVISKSHVADVLTSHDNWDLHIDGTSRSGKKYVGQQVTTKEGSFSLGFIPVATEDASTLVDISIQMLEEVSDLYSEGEAQEHFAHMLLGLSSVMTDRAAVMKSFGRSLEAERQVLLQTDEGLEFLHCNAHFLLGLGSECKKALTAEEREKGELLGRDALPEFNFNRFPECSAYRYIWMACDCLGPRGDDKHGCRDSWEAYCLMVERPSTVTSFRENRFNNMFQAAASLHYHRDDIQEFLSLYMTRKNKKLESVLADCRSEVIDCHIIALGLLYFKITGPYWCLLGGNVHYLDFYLYVENLHRTLLEWQQDASSAFLADLVVFPDIAFKHNADILQSLLSISEEKKAAVTTVLQKISTSLLQVTERQLADFLPDGKYHNIQDEDLRRKLDHSHVTNLVSEQCFADLDFSLFKRRNASLHHHSTINLLKRNKSVSTWLSQKTPQEQVELLKKSARKAPSLRQKHIQAEKDTVRRRQDLLEEARRQKDLAEERKNAQKMEIIEDLRFHRGPCTSVEDIHRLLPIYTTQNGLKKALRAEILFQKIILEKKSPFLKVTGTVLKLLNQLLQFFGGERLERLPPLQVQHQRRRPCRQQSESDSDTAAEDEDEAISSGEAEDPVFHFPRYSFKQEGEIVAVYYEEDFFIGEVTSFVSENEGTVSFMLKANGPNGSLYKWPLRPDCWPISSVFIFASDLFLAPSSSSGRSFIVERPEDLPKRYEAFRQHLNENVH